MERMPDHFHEAVQALKDTADGLIVANTAIKRAADAVLAAREEYREREDSISHLESLVLQLSTEVRALRDRLNNGQH
jgi:hypothetical protein